MVVLLHKLEHGYVLDVKQPLFGKVIVLGQVYWAVF
jgi:hypothetical protein